MKFNLKIALLILMFVFTSCTKSEKEIFSGKANKNIKNEKIVFTYFFSWYDSFSGAHMSQLQEHPAGHPEFNKTPYSYKSVEWYKKELKDMMRTGIDALLFTFWGKVGCLEKYSLKEENLYKGSGDDQWSYIGVDNLVSAVIALKSEGLNPPKIGMFLDTSLFKVHPNCRNIEQPIDLQKPAAKKLFYDTIKSFYKRIPMNLWAKMENKPVIFVYSSDYVGKYDKNLPEQIKENFSKDFNKIEPYLVFDYSWKGLKSDNWYRWGAALHKPTFGGVCQIGPGYNDSAVSDRNKKHVRLRDDGKYYKDSWNAVLDRCDYVAIETWNEFHEGSGIAASNEYGDKYLEITKEYIQKFKNKK